MFNTQLITHRLRGECGTREEEEKKRVFSERKGNSQGERREGRGEVEEPCSREGRLRAGLVWVLFRVPPLHLVLKGMSSPFRGGVLGAKILHALVIP